MNILIRATGVSGDMPPGWYRVPNAENIWIYELRAYCIKELAEEIINISNDLKYVFVRGARLVLHIGKYDDMVALNLDSDILEVICRYNLTLEVY